MTVRRMGSNVGIALAYVDDEGKYRLNALIVIALTYIAFLFVFGSRMEMRNIVIFTVVVAICHKSLARVLARNARYGHPSVKVPNTLKNDHRMFAMEDRRTFKLTFVNGQMKVEGSPCGSERCSVRHGLVATVGFSAQTVRVDTEMVCDGQIQVSIPCLTARCMQMQTQPGYLMLSFPADDMPKLRDVLQGGAGNEPLEFLGSAYFYADPK